MRGESESRPFSAGSRTGRAPDDNVVIPDPAGFGDVAAPAGAGARQPKLLPPNPVFRFYRGGDGIDALRGCKPGEGPGAPEDWVGSTTTSLGSDREGLATLPDGTLLRDAIATDPAGYLGPEHVARFGANPGVLVKLLDAGERLAVHFHPGRAFAREHLGSPFGKTESWIILTAEPGAHMDFGLREPIDRATLARWVERQDSEEMLAALHQVPVKAGDVLLVPAGTLHTIGAGITLIELQEPSDMSVVLERERFDVSAQEATLGLGWDVILTAAQLEPTAPLFGGAGAPPAADPGAPPPPGSTRRNLLPEAADPYFRAEWIVAGGTGVQLEPSFAVLLVIQGEITITAPGAEPLQVNRGGAALVPFGAGATTVSGNGTVVRCLPPSVNSREGKW